MTNTNGWVGERERERERERGSKRERERGGERERERVKEGERLITRLHGTPNKGIFMHALVKEGEGLFD